MKYKSKIKPDFLSFYQSEWKRESHFILCKDGRVFEQVHRNRYRLIYCVLFILLLITSYLSIFLLPYETPKIIKLMPQTLLLLLIFLYPIVTYKISRYKLIEDEELIKKYETDEEDDSDEQG